MWFGIGVMIALAVGLIVWVVLKATKKDCKKYDERQIVARGKAYRAGFVAFVICEIAVFFIELFTEKPLVLFGPGILQILILFVCLLVFVEYAIFSDAYYSVGQAFNIKWCIIMMLLGAVFIFQFLRSKDDWFKSYTFIAGIFIEIAIISIIIKHAINKKRDAALDKEDSEE
ncbi:MAG: hypothetical protein K5907_03180 [Treponema sp.]|nr:hypothetical protein [Treponema sp.]